MAAGPLRHRITIKRNTITRSASGAEVQTPVDVATVWAAIKTISGAEQIDATQTNIATQTHEMTIRYRTGIEPSMFVEWGDRLLSIRAVIDLENRRKWLTLLCDETIDQAGA
jgi:SPP1 family predicted phage head-tail adaptor